MPEWNLSVREKLRYKNIEWLMPSVDVVAILEKLGIEEISVHGNEIKACCPDHKLFVGRESSDPNWWVNTETGLTMCFTEGRGSNLLWTVSRLLDIHPKEAAKFLMQTDSDIAESTLQMARSKKFRSRIAPSRFGDGVEEDDRPKVRGLSSIRRDMANRYMSDLAYDFFMNPPGKPRTDILPATVDHYQVFERTYGTYTNRVIIPFTMNGEVVGFCAIDILGKKKWLEIHPLKNEKNYRKVLYPENFVAAGDWKHNKGCLFGFDDCVKGCDLLFIVEGPREVMKLWQEGYTNAVAILGGYLGEGQRTLITEIAPKRIALMFDGDDAGRMITDRVEERLRRNYQGKTLIRCHVPYGKDPKNLNRADYDALLAR